MALNEINNQVMNLKKRAEGLAERYLGAETCNDAKEFADNHPFIVSTIILTLVFSAIPIIFFLCFAAISALISVVCLICIEGFLLIVGGLILAGVVSFIAIITTGVILSFSIAFWFAQRFHNLICYRTSIQATAVPVEEKQDADSSDT